MHRRIWLLLILLCVLISGCAPDNVRNIDAASGKSSASYHLSEDSTVFLGATPAGLYLDNALIAVIPRGDRAEIKLPCGKHELGVKPPDGGPHSFHMQTISFDPCDGGLPYLHISFVSFRGFFLTREKV